MYFVVLVCDSVILIDSNVICDNDLIFISEALFLVISHNTGMISGFQNGALI